MNTPGTVTLPSPPTPDVEAAGRVARNNFTYALTLACVVGLVGLAATRTGSVVEHAVDTLGGVLETLVLAYLTTSVADRAGVLSGIASRMRFGPQNPPSP